MNDPRDDVSLEALRNCQDWNYNKAKAYILGMSLAKNEDAHNEAERNYKRHLMNAEELDTYIALRCM